MKPLEPNEKLARENQRLKIDLANIRALNRKLLRRGAGYDEFIESLREFNKQDNFKYRTGNSVRMVEPFDPNHEEIACVACSDLHLTETVRGLEANGINTYGSVVAANRLWQHSQKVVSILARHKAMYRLSYIWVPMLGDMINGSVHSEFVTTNDLSDPAAVILCKRLLQMFLTELKVLNLPIQIDTIVGNHPRMTAKVPTKNIAHTNLDWLVYEGLADAFYHDQQISTEVWTSQIGMRQLYGWRYLFEHGIDVHNGREEELEDRLRALFDDPIYRKATGLTGASFDQIVIGNLHKSKFLERTIVNGAYTGQNELGMSWRLKPIKAQQLMWGVSKKHPRTWQYQIDLTDITSDKATNPMSEYAKWFVKRHGRAT